MLYRQSCSRLQVDPFPVTHGQFPNGELIDHQALSRQAISPFCHFSGKKLPGSIGAVVVAGDSIQRPLEGIADLFYEAPPFAPPHGP